MDDLNKLRNLGPASIRMLHAAHINSEAQLRQLGAIAAYMAVQRNGEKPSLNLLWALEGALSDRDWKTVARDDRTTMLLTLTALQEHAG